MGVFFNQPAKGEATVFDNLKLREKA